MKPPDHDRATSSVDSVGAGDELSRVLDAYLAQRAAGEATSREQLISDHPELMPQLAESLRRLDLIDRAKRQLDGQHSANTIEVARFDGDTAASVRCPHCRSLVEMGAPDEVQLECMKCRQVFRLSDVAESLGPIQTIGRFELVNCVGVGGFGTVWKAVDRQLDRVVAIKLPRQQPTGRDREDFLNEARIAAQLKHRHIVDVYEIGAVAGTIYIVSDFIDGVSLDVWAEQNPVSATEASTLVAKLCEAVEVAHEAGIVHRDLKPGNILMDRSGEPTITDFGLAKQFAPDMTVTLDGRILGTPAYMSPEQAAGHSAVADARSDVYSLGVILFELLTRERPFRGQTPMLIHQVVHDDPPPPRQLDVSVPQDLETITLKCLEKDPDARFSSAGVLAAEINRFLVGEPICSRPLGRFARLARWVSRKPVISAALAIITLLLVALVTAGWWAYFDERNDGLALRSALKDAGEALEQEQLMRQALLQTEDFRKYQEAVEAIASDQRLHGLLRNVGRSTQLEEQIRLLRSPSDHSFGSPEWSAAQIAFVEQPVITAIQGWLETQDPSALPDIFAWFVLDSSGTQLARSPRDRSIGRNYAWRTYFHGGTRDFLDYADYAKHAPAGKSRLQTTYLSRGLFTEVTKQFVFTISTPMYEDDELLGVVGLMVALASEQSGVSSEQ